MRLFDSLEADIIECYENGLDAEDTARQLACTPAEAQKTIDEYVAGNHPAHPEGAIRAD